MQLKFEISKQHIKRTDCEKPVADSQNYLYAHFDFLTDEWLNVPKSVNFWKNGTAYTLLLDEDNNTLVPWEVIKEGVFEVSCFGGDLITNDRAKVLVIKSGYKQGVTPPPPTPDVYATIVANYERLNGIIKTDGAGDKYLADDGTYKDVEGGDSKIEHILVNDVEQAIVDKKVNIPVPTKTNDLINNSGYITDNAIPIKSITRNGEEVVPDVDKNVDIAVPENTSDLNNDSDFVDGVQLAKVKDVADTALSIAKQAEQAVAYTNYQTMVNAFNTLPVDTFNIGQSVFIQTLNVPDLWVYGVVTESVPYTYIDDDTIVNIIETQGFIQIGYYLISRLNTGKIDLTNYVQKTDYATANTAGVVKLGYGVVLTQDGKTAGTIESKSSYQTWDNRLLMSKGTLENLKTRSTDVLTVYDDVSIPTTAFAKKYVDEAIVDIQTDPGINMYPHGSPTVTMGIASGFGINDYLEFPRKVTIGNRPFELKFAITTGAGSLVDQQNIIDSDFGMAFAIQNSKFVIVMSSNGTGWNITNGARYGVTTLQPLTPYYVKITWDGQYTYKVQISTDDETYIDDIVVTTQTVMSLYPKTMFVGVGNLFFEAPRNYFAGSINFNIAYLKLEDEIAWTGVKENFAQIDLSNLNEQGQQVVKSLAIDATKPIIKTELPSDNIIVDNTSYRLGEQTTFEIALPSSPNEDFLDEIVFVSGATATAFTYPDEIKWSGADLTDNKFVPVANKRYTVVIWYDGVWNGIARGV